MKSKKVAVVVVIIALIGIGIGWWIKLQRPETHSGRQTEMAKVSHYTCPMHPQIVSDKPGSCPVCGMDLVLADQNTDGQHDHEQMEGAEEGTTSTSKKPHDHTEVKLSLKKQQLIGVKLEEAQERSLFKSIRAPGRIAFDPELYTAQSEYLEALRQWRRIKDSPILDVKESTRQMIRSSKIRLKVLGLSDDQISKLSRKGTLSEGLLVTGKGQENWIYADIFEVDLPYIEEGLSAQITANFLQGKTLAAKVVSVDQVINPETRTAKVRLQLINHDSSIRPESYVNVTIFAPVGAHVSVPLEALMDTGRETFVFVKKEGGQFEPRKVSVLLETETRAAIRSGLQAGETVVVGGNFMLDSESRLKSVIQNAQSEMSGSGHKH